MHTYIYRRIENNVGFYDDKDFGTHFSPFGTTYSFVDGNEGDFMRDAALAGLKFIPLDNKIYVVDFVQSSNDPSMAQEYEKDWEEAWAKNVRSADLNSNIFEGPLPTKRKYSFSAVLCKSLSVQIDASSIDEAISKLENSIPSIKESLGASGDDWNIWLTEGSKIVTRDNT